VARAGNSLQPAEIPGSPPVVRVGDGVTAGVRPGRVETGGCDVYRIIVTYTVTMKRLQIYIEPEMDEALALDAARDGVSKAAIIRRLIAQHLGGRGGPDPIDDLVGRFEGQPGDIDEVVYGR